MRSSKKLIGAGGSVVLSLFLVISMTAVPASAATTYIYSCHTFYESAPNQADRYSEANWYGFGGIRATAETRGGTSGQSNNLCFSTNGHVVEAGLIMTPFIGGAAQTICVWSGSGYQDPIATWSRACTDNGLYTKMEVRALHRAWISGTPVDDPTFAAINP